MERLISSLESDLDFTESGNNSRLHNFHSFPAKFPPGIPARMIKELTKPGDVVLDPMCGSGTTLVEALLLDRKAIGFDIDPLAILISSVKTTNLEKELLLGSLETIVYRASIAVGEEADHLIENCHAKWDKQTSEFVNYWFSSYTQLELSALINEIEKIENLEIRSFFKLCFSSTIITKTGGVSLALDLAHTRPHKAKEVIQKQLPPVNYSFIQEAPVKPYLSKTIKSAIAEFKKKATANIQSVGDFPGTMEKAKVSVGDARSMNLDMETVDLIVTSPPYASNAIDYMRAHKFSLVWLGYSIEKLSGTRSEYVGSESLSRLDLTRRISPTTLEIYNKLLAVDERKAKTVLKYYQESEQILSEMFRVLRHGGNMVYVVGTSIIKGIDIQIADCLAEIGESVGFVVPKIASRKINRDKRMMPTSRNKNSESQIENRMHEEFVIGFYKG